MFGTRSATARLEHLLVILATYYGREEDGILIVDRTITYEQLATMVGVTRQWVSTTLENLQAKGILKLTRTQLQITSLESLRKHLDIQSNL